jgi:DNA-binding CsgD family transcriptional regulator
MRRNRLDQALAMGVATVAVLHTLSALSMPVPARRFASWITVLSGALIIGHAALYWLGERIRERAGVGRYVTLQATTVVLVGLSGALIPVGMVLYAALTAEVVLLAGPQWGTMPITIAAVGLFGVSAMATSNLYFAATSTLVLAVTGLLAHAIGALVQRRAQAEPVDVGGLTASASTASTASPAGRDGSGLTAREQDVLRALAKGARSSDIADQLGIAERTVKAHLASIYQKLGVESRTAAVALALQIGLVEGPRRN